MNCIFCKKISADSKSVEHIIPESLGNKKHVLDKGIVCDKCNSYFSVKIEKHVLDLPYFRSVRKRNEIPSKKNKVPSEIGFLGDLVNGKVEVFGVKQNSLQIVVENKELFEKILKGEFTDLKIPIHKFPPKDNILLSRFLGKVALEALAQKVKNVDNWNEDFISNEGLDRMRNYVRYGKGKFWSYSFRKVYEEFDTFSSSQKENFSYQILNEYDFLYLEESYLIFICIIMGIEYSIMLNEPNLDIYQEWLKKN